jgi:16S rRNA (adenine1518-N6/adenine1519-N6)-dimethyltransferase
MPPKKSLGQHWLHDDASLEAMVRAGEVKPSDTVVEVGPGLGTLTKKLVDIAENVIAIELDDLLAAGLSERVKAKNLQVVHENILQYDFSQVKPGYKVVANIPYYLTSNLIRTLLESSNPPSSMALLVQKEVAERIVATPGSMSILAISVQFYAEAKLCELVPAQLFTPPPKVDSQIIQIKLRTKPLFNEVDVDEFFKIVRAGFSEKRKKLRSSLSGGLRLEKAMVDEWLQRAKLKPEARAQELTLEEWFALYQSRVKQ